MALVRLQLAKRTSPHNLQHCDGRRPVLPCVEDSVRRPQRPGNHSRTEVRCWRNPPDNSPSRITRNRRLCRNALAGHAEHLAAMSALCAFTRMRIKRKSARVCEEAVNARDSLWKALEKSGGTPTSRAAVYRHKQPSTLPRVGTSCSAHYAAHAG